MACGSRQNESGSRFRVKWLRHCDSMAEAA
jgi:hypothetical protein